MLRCGYRVLSSARAEHSGAQIPARSLACVCRALTVCVRVCVQRPTLRAGNGLIVICAGTEKIMQKAAKKGDADDYNGLIRPCVDCGQRTGCWCDIGTGRARDGTTDFREAVFRMWNTWGLHDSPCTWRP